MTGVIGTGRPTVQMPALGPPAPTPLDGSQDPDRSGEPGRVDASDRPQVVVRRVLVLGAALLLVGLHFRPYQGGTLEDWGLALAWEGEGLAGFWTRLPGVLGRPLHLVPAYLGLAATDGGFVGQYGVLALVAVGQLLVGIWALRAAGTQWPVAFALSFALAAHPWWSAGDVLRFAPAQVSVLAVVVWFGACARFLRTGRRAWLLLTCAAPVVGLLTYQAPALVFLLGGVTVAVASGAARRGAVVVACTLAAVAASLLWSAVVAPRLSPGSYEEMLLAGRAGTPQEWLYQALRTMALHGKVLLLLAGTAVVVVLSLGLAQRLTKLQTWVLLAAVAASPLASLVYAANPLHLRDPERVLLPVALALWVVVAAASAHLGVLDRRGILVTVLGAVGVLAGAGWGYLHWSAVAAAQQDLVTAVGAVRDEVPAGSTVVVADQSGRYGDVYTLLPPHLDYAVVLEFGPGPETQLCTPAGVVRDQPVAALFPLTTTPDCTSLLSVPGTVPITTVDTALGQVTLYEVPTAVP